jgi:hypothetical protein
LILSSASSVSLSSGREDPPLVEERIQAVALFNSNRSGGGLVTVQWETMELGRRISLEAMEKYISFWKGNKSKSIYQPVKICMNHTYLGMIAFCTYACKF